MMRYIIAKLPEHTAARDLWLYDIKTMKDVRGWVTSQGEVAFIKAADVAELRKAVSEIVVAMNAAKYKRVLKKGSKASTREGPFAGRIGSIQWINKKRAELEIIALGGRTITVNAPVDSLEAA